MTWERVILGPSFYQNPVFFDEWGHILSTRMAVPALVRCVIPIGIPEFQHAFPCQNSIPLVELAIPALSRWCSWMSKIWGGFWREANQALMSFCLAVPLVSPLTLRDIMVMGRSDMVRVDLGGLAADRSHVVALCGLGVVVTQSSGRLRGGERGAQGECQSP